MNRKKYKKQLLFTSAIIASFIFFGGLLLGITIDDLKVNDVLDPIKQNELDTESYLTEQTFLELYGGDSCELLTPRVQNIKTSINKINTELAQYVSEKSLNQKDYDYLKRKYIILEVRALNLVTNLIDTCDADYVPILFFYEIDHQDSMNQGFTLDLLREEYPEELLVLTFDKDYPDEPLIELLVTKYNITQAPALVIGDEAYEGYIDEQGLRKIIEPLINK